MKKIFAFGGVLYVGIGAFLTLAIYLRGSDSAYTSDQPWFEAPAATASVSQTDVWPSFRQKRLFAETIFQGADD
jgi:hypothetical protein